MLGHVGRVANCMRSRSRMINCSWSYVHEIFFRRSSRFVPKPIRNILLNCSQRNCRMYEISNSSKQFCSEASLPECHKVLLPALSPTMEMGTIMSWEKKEGDKLNEGDLLAEIETDKATMGFETPEEGYLAKILVPAGTKNVPLGKLLCVIVSNEEDIVAFKDYVDTGTSKLVANENIISAASVSKVQVQSSHQIPSSPSRLIAAQQQSIPDHELTASSRPVSGLKRPFASPLAQKIAREKGLDLNKVKGSGPGGRIRAEDLEAIPTQTAATLGGEHEHIAAPSQFIDIPLTNIRQLPSEEENVVIAQRLLLSKQTVPHYYLSMQVRMDELIALRSDLNDVISKDGKKLSVNDFIVKASALACMNVPTLNSSWQDTFIRQYHTVDINIAVSTESGLITPIVFSAEKKGLSTISSEIKSLAERAREGKLKPQEYQGGTFTISNLGMFGIKSFAAIINPPQSCILAVGSLEDSVFPDSSASGYHISKVMNVTLSCDHRVVDGAVGAKWLMHFKKYIEKPQTMLL